MALDNNFISGFAGLTSSLIRKHPPCSVAMVKGHLDQTQKKQHSNKPKTNPTPDELKSIADTSPDSRLPANAPTYYMQPAWQKWAKSSPIRLATSSLHLALAITRTFLFSTAMTATQPTLSPWRTNLPRKSLLLTNKPTKY
jgi:hypothetical protein